MRPLFSTRAAGFVGPGHKWPVITLENFRDSIGDGWIRLMELWTWLGWFVWSTGHCQRNLNGSADGVSDDTISWGYRLWTHVQTERVHRWFDVLFSLRGLMRKKSTLNNRTTPKKEKWSKRKQNLGKLIKFDDRRLKLMTIFSPPHISNSWWILRKKMKMILSSPFGRYDALTRGTRVELDGWFGKKKFSQKDDLNLSPEDKLKYHSGERFLILLEKNLTQNFKYKKRGDDQKWVKRIVTRLMMRGEASLKLFYAGWGERETERRALLLASSSSSSPLLFPTFLFLRLQQLKSDGEKCSSWSQLSVADTPLSPPIQSYHCFSSFVGIFALCPPFLSPWLYTIIWWCGCVLWSGWLTDK